MSVNTDSITTALNKIALALRLAQVLQNTDISNLDINFVDGKYIVSGSKIPKQVFKSINEITDKFNQDIKTEPLYLMVGDKYDNLRPVVKA